MSTMEYIDDAPAAPTAPPGGADKYHGAIAEGYDAKREQSPKHIVEQRVIEDMLSDLPPGTKILDCPVGTGRFLPYYMAKGFKFIGADLSGDMLVESAKKVGGSVDDINAWVAASNKAGKILQLEVADGVGFLAQGDIRKIGLPDKNMDCAVACRITRWLSPDDCQQMMRELQRVCRQRIIWTARVANHPHARTVELFEAALNGWKITRNEAGYVLDYRILMAEPA